MLVLLKVQAFSFTLVPPPQVGVDSEPPSMVQCTDRQLTGVHVALSERGEIVKVNHVT